jgi:hypothetical protein
MGMLIPRPEGKLIFPVIREDGLTDEEHIEVAVGIFLRGLASRELGGGRGSHKGRGD